MEGREMAYNPTTWGSNDVITKDRLNKMEQGVRAGTLLSGTDIDADKNWNGKSVTNVNALEARQMDAVIRLPPASSRLVSVSTTSVTPALLASGAGPYNPPYAFEVTLFNHTISSNLTGYGVPTSHSLVKVTIRYTYRTTNSGSYAGVRISGVDCPGLKTSGSTGGANRVVEKSIWVKTGSQINIYACCPHNDDSYHEPTLSDISITLIACFPFGTITSANYGVLVNLPGAILTPYSFAHEKIECTCNYDGALATMTDYAARSFFPLQPTTIELGWKTGTAWADTPPSLQFYKGV